MFIIYNLKSYTNYHIEAVEYKVTNDTIKNMNDTLSCSFIFKAATFSPQISYQVENEETQSKDKYENMRKHMKQL